MYIFRKIHIYCFYNLFMDKEMRSFIVEDIHDKIHPPSDIKFNIRNASRRVFARKRNKLIKIFNSRIRQHVVEEE